MEFTFIVVNVETRPSSRGRERGCDKPSEFTSASTIAFMELIDAVGFPGVVNTVTGYGPEIMEIIRNPKVAKVAFTGSDYSGQKVYEQAASGIKHICLELGGKVSKYCFLRMPT